ncbi:U-scoloptoxin(19)-Sm1a-like [Sitophilus oryzae]|uniref:U-scoloptoxin(19)-Sm1a-like n=1 Tax=Sitophilus oryzae TaxID=7048 RepID=A0A6J2XEX2_SITOR|nr:U-scoloptoxin(19)-Sm1a-like [Sitophilus oryzae]
MKQVLIIVCIVTLSYCDLESNFYREEPCASKKGYCVLEKECPGPLTADVKNKCPQQHKEGAVCCTSIPQDQLNCRQLHNECQSTCPPNLSLGRKGCPVDTQCCVLV